MHKIPAAPPARMRLVFLGTSAAQPTERRGMSCTCLRIGAEVLMFDAGEGAQLAYLRSGMGLNRRMRVFITHMHGDHCIGLLGLLQTMGLQGRTEPLEVFGPAGVGDFVSENMRILGFGLPFPVSVSPAAEGRVAGGAGYDVHACAADHTVPALSYRVDERGRPGRFHPERARAAGVPEGRLWGELQAGREVEAGGRAVSPSQVLGPPRRGRRVGISGDTRPSARLRAFFAGCDCLVFDSTFAGDLADKARATGHSTASGAAELARAAGAGRLVLTHFSARYGDEAALAREAGRIHGRVVAARDMMEVDV